MTIPSRHCISASGHLGDMPVTALLQIIGCHPLHKALLRTRLCRLMRAISGIRANFFFRVSLYAWHGLEVLLSISNPQLPLLSSREALTRQASDQLWPGQVQASSETENRVRERWRGG